MRVEQLGDGTPEIAVVGGIHGDEPCGVHAVETFLDERPDVERPVKLVVANEEAIARDARYVDEDLNRAFPGDPDGRTHESRLAAALREELADCATLALHSTQSYDEPFALVSGVGEFERDVCARLPVDAVVDVAGFTNGRIFASVQRTVEVECGYQKSDAAAENAVALTRAFLSATGALPAKYESVVDHPVFRLEHRIQKNGADAYEVFADNFERVDAGEAYAAADGKSVVAEESFYPVLLSAYGYDDLFGFAAERVDTIDG